MRRMSPVTIVLAGVSVAALTISGAYAATSAADQGDEPSTVVNKNGHEVDEHAADGQARAAQARAAANDRKAERPDQPVEPGTPVSPAESEPETAPGASTPTAGEAAPPHEDHGNHGGPNEAAGDHPNENAFVHPQGHEPQGPQADHSDNSGGYGPNEHAGDHPNEHATADDKGGRK